MQPWEIANLSFFEFRRLPLTERIRLYRESKGLGPVDPIFPKKDEPEAIEGEPPIQHLFRIWCASDQNVCALEMRDEIDEEEVALQQIKQERSESHL